jgi:serine/threonine protein kinase/formylglycine-generating enzyme required for sulfatase activity/cephalosporin-C deacetylase-like acetyl esterase
MIHPTMEPDRWRQVEGLYHAALERDPEVRAAFLAEASGGDKELLDEVQSLLEQHTGDSRLDRAVWEPGREPTGTRFAAGTQLGQYRIEAALGAGGMGEVFRARDSRLNRTVAIKISQRRFTGRFKSEARAVAALNHPNIVQIYELGSEAGDDFIVMEFVPGRTLAELLCAAPLDLDQALEYANQIASALAAAHAAGVVHRDIKPGNIIVNDTGVVKILDFGLAKVEQTAVAGDTTVTAGAQTGAGTVMGTAAYMSPEQAECKAVDARSDIFSIGAVFYEMLTGSRAFDGNSTLGVLSKVLRETPRGIRELRPEVPEAIARIVSRCLEKNPALRYPSGREFAGELIACRRPARQVALSTRARVITACVVIAAITSAGWFYYRAWRARWTRNEALPKIQALMMKNDYPAAFELTRTALRYLPDDPQLKQHWSELSLPITFTTTPPGAKVSYRPYGDTTSPWRLLGVTPFDGVRSPGAYVRLRVEKDGSEPEEFATHTFFLQGQNMSLYHAGRVPAGMVPVPAQAPWAGPSDVMPLPDYFLDKFEVTNRQFQQFVDAGGYRDLKYWRDPFRKDGREIPFEQAIASFRDSTGRPGPAGWELGAFPKDHAEFPVSGVSWFEANAYCAYAGKALPTVHHWWKAAGFGIFSDILLFSNFAGKGPARVGAHIGISAFGAYDMAGNVKEWCQNNAGALRAILGGGWNEPSYAYRDEDAQDPFTRASTYGLRCASYQSGAPPAALAAMGGPSRDYSTEKPVSDDTFEIFRRMYAYDKIALDAKTESVDDSNEYWRKEKVSYRAAYGGQRIPAYLYLPKNAKPPYQTVLWVPGGYAWQLRNSETGMGMEYLNFLPRTGRAVLYPVYQGTFERGTGELPWIPGPNAFRETLIQIAKDVSRSVDFLESRPDIQSGRLAYYGISTGGTWGQIFLAVEPRLKTGILAAGGLYSGTAPAEVDVFNFAPRVRVPVLMLNGRYDFAAPSATLQQPMFRLLGTPERDKRHIQFDTGHLIPLQDLMRETLNWLDRYIGPVETNH